MKKFGIGLLVGFLIGSLFAIFIASSFIEAIHIEVEKNSAISFCSILTDATGKWFSPKLQNFIKITFKIFAQPIKTILISGVPNNVNINTVN